MIKKESLEELQKAIRENPDQTCLLFNGGKMFAVLEGDRSCVTGTSQLAGQEVIDGKTYEIYVGGETPVGSTDTN